MNMHEKWELQIQQEQFCLCHHSFTAIFCDKRLIRQSIIIFGWDFFVNQRFIMSPNQSEISAGQGGSECKQFSVENYQQ